MADFADIENTTDVDINFDKYKEIFVDAIPSIFPSIGFINIPPPNPVIPPINEPKNEIKNIIISRNGIDMLGSTGMSVYKISSI
ncbi:hypothetical protein GCM10008904_27210 [Paraclostridium ghonii]